MALFPRPSDPSGKVIPFKMLFSALPLSFLLLIEAHAQSSLTLTSASASLDASSILLSGTNTAGSSIPNLGGDLLPTGSEVSYISYSTTSTQNDSTVILATTFAAANGSVLSRGSSTRSSSTSTRISLLRGTKGASATTSGSNSTSNSTASRTSTSAAPINTQPCNNYPEFCSRSYSNITFVAAHNSPFVNPNNAAANQQLPVLNQLNDGIRMLQGQTHYNSTTNTISYCHTSCDLLNGGTAQEYFANITSWVQAHPYDIITLLIGNSDFIGVGNYTVPLEASGLSQYAYIPPQVPMNISSWPTLSSMILMRKRVVIFMDYNANQTEVPYILDEFSQMWETPFSPTNRSFPCTQQRPPGINHKQAEQRMYIANHNLNTEISLAGTSLLVPSTPLLNETNAVNGTGSLGLMANNCAGTTLCPCFFLFSESSRKLTGNPLITAAWPRPPNFLLVDYYNEGSYPGSVFEVAAQHNKVTYNRACCGLVSTAAASESGPLPLGLLIGVVGFWGVLLM